MRHLALLLFVTTALAQQHATPKAALSLCSAKERVIFSCPTKTPAKIKIVSICASPMLTADSGYWQYRFGVVGQTPELIFPQTQEHPKKNFQAGTMAFSGGGGAYLEFSNGGYKYVVFSAGGRNWMKEGVAISKGGKPMAALRCQTGSAGDFGPDVFEKAAIQEANDFFDLPW